jgi:hypothetical protein
MARVGIDVHHQQQDMVDAAVAVAGGWGRDRPGQGNTQELGLELGNMHD